MICHSFEQSGKFARRIARLHIARIGLATRFLPQARGDGYWELLPHREAAILSPDGSGRQLWRGVTVVCSGLKLPTARGVSDWIETGLGRGTLFVGTGDWRVPEASMR